MKQNNKRSQKKKFDSQNEPQENDMFLQCPDRLSKHFSAVMNMRIDFPRPTVWWIESIQKKIKALFEIEIEDAVAKEFFWLQYAITVNDSYYGYSKHNFMNANWIKDNKKEIENLPDIQQAEAKSKRAQRLEALGKDKKSNMLQTMFKIIKDNDTLMEECIELIRLSSMEGFPEEMEEKNSQADNLKSEERQKEDAIFDLIRDKTSDGRLKKKTKLPLTGGTDDEDDLLFPAILGIQIKIITNFPAVISRLKRYIDFEDSGNLLPRLQRYIDLKGSGKDPEKMNEEEKDLIDAFKEIYSVKSEDMGENLWLIEAIQERYIEKKSEQVNKEALVPQTDKPYHSFVKALYEFIDVVFSKSNPTKNRQLANWILAESGILLNEALFEKINSNNKVDNTPYGDYKEYLKSINPIRDR